MKPNSRVDRRQCVTCARQLPERYSKAEKCRACHLAAVKNVGQPQGACVDCGKILRNPTSVRCRTCWAQNVRRSSWQPRPPDWQPRGALVVEASPTSEIERAYAAGMVDGEGHIALTPYKATYLPIANVTNTDPRIVDWLDQRWSGGSHTLHEPSNRNHKVRHNWRLSGRRAYTFLKEIQPYLVLKAAQAELVFAYYDQGGYFQHGADRLPAQEVIRRAELHLQCKTLNARGPAPGVGD
jgi:hypothetical protein